jgi:hypothetical protein
MFSIIEEFDNDSFIMCGDWNLVLDPEYDLYNCKSVNNPKARDRVISYSAEMELVDIWKSFHDKTPSKWHG